MSTKKSLIVFFCYWISVTCGLTLPDTVIMGYANWMQCDDSIIEAVKDGVNVLMWFSVNLAVRNGLAEITSGPDLKCVARIAKELDDLNLPTIHLISIGGWNSPHPDTSVPVQTMFQEFKRWNDQDVANPELGFRGFDGFDWDIEGHDTLTHPNNLMTSECVAFMGEFSQLGKQNGYIVSMAPAESYLDPTTSVYDRILTHAYPEWTNLQPKFTYHGHNSYAPLLSSKYGKTLRGEEWVDTFDLIFIQFYEGYSHALYNITILQQDPTDYIVNFVTRVAKGWTIDFSKDPSIHVETQTISAPTTKLILGLANGWAGDGKFLLLWPQAIENAFKKLQKLHLQPLGCGFWNIKDEGRKNLYLAQSLNQFLQTRSSSPLSESF